MSRFFEGKETLISQLLIDQQVIARVFLMTFFLISTQKIEI